MMIEFVVNKKLQKSWQNAQAMFPKRVILRIIKSNFVSVNINRIFIVTIEVEMKT